MTPSIWGERYRRVKQALARAGHRAMHAYRIRRLPCIRVADAGLPTDVDKYWSAYTISVPEIETTEASAAYLDEVSRSYPLYFEYCGLYDSHEGETVLDYGCGPGNDLVGWLLRSTAKRVVGVDVSRRALELARRRIALHRVKPSRVEFILTTDGASQVPLPDASVDHVSCLGVLHHTMDPLTVLREFRRILAPGGSVTVMVYNADSVYLHLNIAYERQVLAGDFAGLRATEAYAALSDGGAPLSRCYHSDEFLALCREAGLGGEYVGGAFSHLELEGFRKHRKTASQDPRLAQEHRDFLAELKIDDRGFPHYRGFTAGLDGVFSLRAVESTAS